MSRDKFGKTISSSVYRLSDALWLKEVRENIWKLVGYIEHVDSFQISKELDSEQFQRKVFGKTIPKSYELGKFKQAAVSIARIKNEFPEMVKQLESSGNKVFNLSSLRFIFFRHVERQWRIPEKDREGKIETVNSFVLFAPSVSRVLSFETPEIDLAFEQFKFGRVENVQLQGAFSKIKGNAHRKTTMEKKFADFMSINFIFRTVRDVRTVYNAKRLENFSFISTSDAGEKTFKMAFYFAMLGKITDYSPLPISSNMPATMKQVIVVDSTGTQKLQMFGSVNKDKEPMGENIREFFEVGNGQQAEKLHKNNFVIAIARWALGDEFPEILYLKDLGGSISQDKVDYFYMLAYLNTRKKILFQSLKENFPKSTTDDNNFLVKDKFVYLLQHDWDKEMFSHIIDKAKEEGDISFIDPNFPIGLYFHINHDAKKLYMSNNPEEDFSQIFNVPLPLWAYMPKEEDFVYVGNESLETYVAKAIINLGKVGKTILTSKGSVMSTAVDVSQIILSNLPDYYVEDVQISSEMVNDGYGKSHYVSNIKITISKNKQKEEPKPSIPNYYGL